MNLFYYLLVSLSNHWFDQLTTSMESVLKFIFYSIIWLFVPIILAIVIRFLATVHKKTSIKAHRYASRAGFWAGFMLFMIVLIYQMTVLLQVGFPHNDIFGGFNIWLSLLVALIVFIVATPAVISTWLILVFTFISFSSLFHYIFIRTYNDIILSVVTGVAFGFLAHLAASVSSVSEFLNKKDSSLE